MRSIIKFLIRALPMGFGLLLLAGQPALAAPPSGFLARLDGYAPFYMDRASADAPITLPRVEGQVIVVYNHGTKAAYLPENCMRSNAEPPNSLRRLEGERLRIFFLCSEATEDREGVLGNYVFRRVEEIERTVRRLVAAGVPASHIVLAGHSAGGWSSLMLQSTRDLGIAGVVAFAPAFAGPRAGEALGLTWRTIARPAQIQQLKTGRPLRALFFAYPGDEFEWPEDLAFLPQTFPDSVEMVSYSCRGVREPHTTHQSDCREEETAQKIRAFIEAAVQRAAAAGR